MAPKAGTTLLGIAEQSRTNICATLQTQARSLHGHGISPEIVVHSGEPVHQIIDQTSKSNYDLVNGAMDWRGGILALKENHEVIKTVQPQCWWRSAKKQLKRFLVCTGGKEFIEQAARFTGKLAAAVNASHVAAPGRSRPPYADLVRLEEMSISYSNRNRLGSAPAKKRTRTPRCFRRRSSSARDCDRSSLRRSARGRLRFDRDRHITGAGTASPLHHGRSDSQHLESRECSRARRARRPGQAGSDSLEGYKRIIRQELELKKRA